MRKKAIFWDFDGTLSHPNRSFETALYAALVDCGYDAEWEKTKEFMRNVYPWNNPLKDHTQETGENFWAGIYDRLSVFYREEGIDRPDAVNVQLRNRIVSVENYTLYDDTISTLKTCMEMGYDNYLLTNNYPEITKNAELLGIAPYLKSYVVSSHIGFDKPKREIFEYAKKLAGEPGVCYMIGDNPVADIGGAAASGMKTIYVHNGKLEQADHSVDTLREILSIVE